MSFYRLIGNYRFAVEIESMFLAGFSEVSGLTIETEYEEYREGGVNEFTHKIVTGTKHIPITLKRGITSTNGLWDWYNDVVSGKIVRRSGAIILLDEQFDEYRRWTFYDAYPIKWVGPEFNATSSEVAIEQLELAHNGFKLL